MKQIALTIEQMKHLQELGVDTSKASMKFVSMYPSRDYIEECTDFIPVSRNFYAKHYNEAGPTFTMQDILEILPDELRITRTHFQDGSEYWVGNFMTEWCDFNFDSDNPLDLAYQMLCWVAENGY